MLTIRILRSQARNTKNSPPKQALDPASDTPWTGGFVTSCATEFSGVRSGPKGLLLYGAWDWWKWAGARIKQKWDGELTRTTRLDD